ncbi:precorrin-3B C(17)-methyltransferase [Devosia rhodophyticola]|uniref:Precorrin-3B C(17)-methyltransferase n=1 Tax=Devosia rhodophyticola TaxID=3026423 RepID=A0ABY7YZB2_9HYPH|nr:precorrin-3B C(17)-methyltransferase [Devosia rhodophyticola]WDR06592.1 precorrin-3B C(17)-methyltransferase [Devosia rhodophyticola]
MTFSSAGAATANAIAAITGSTVIADGKTALPRLFASGTPIIGVCAAGILIRLLADLISDKHDEPPVLAVSADGTHIVPLLGGHHGANQLARHLASALGGTAALTTASDARFSRGLDEPPEGYVIADPLAAKSAMISVLEGEAITLTGDAPWLAAAGYPVSQSGTVAITITEKNGGAGLVIHPKILIAGVGCERGTDPSELIGLIEKTLATAGLTPLSLAAIASIDLKADEAALHTAATHFGVPLRVFSAADLNAESDRLVTPSAIVAAETGTPGVSEAAALKAGVLLVPKQKSKRATCAIGKAPSPITVEQFGRAPGQLHIVGIGPGEAISRTASAVSALDAASDWVGYGLYLDLIADLHDHQHQHRFPLGDEEPRVRHALELAATGKIVALVCSGDAQIYAMAALVYELLDVTGARALSDAACRVGVASHPGISALQSASATAGALLGHDFCAISLSDLLTPREDIIKRLHAAAEGDFVTAFYNPRSKRRTDLIELAKAIYLDHRPSDTPVVIGTSVGRPEENVRVTTLGTFDPSEVDMLTIVLFGASTSRALKRGNGQTYAYTPRGYERKSQS